MIYGSVCSGIEAATVAWHPLGWQAAFFAEIEAFPSAVLAHHYPEVPNLGDFTRIGVAPDAVSGQRVRSASVRHGRLTEGGTGTASPDDCAGRVPAKPEDFHAGSIDLLVGGTPCQDFSVAGLRAGMDGQRGQLTIEFARLAQRLRPRWLVWENVPGVLSIDGGRAFGTFLGLLGELGYGIAYRVLDAQHFGVPQRRRRVFVVGHLGDWRRAAAVLFERHSLSGHPAPRRETRQDVARGIAIGPSGGEFTDLSCTLDARCKDGAIRNQLGMLAAHVPDVARFLSTSNERIDWETETFVTHALRAEGLDASEDGTGRGTPLVPDVAPCLTRNYGKQPDNSDTNAGPMLVPVDVAPYTLAIRGRGDSHDLEYRQDGIANAILTPNGGRGGIGVGAVALPILEAGARTGKSTDDPRAGIGVGEAGDPMFTLQAGKQHAVGFAQNTRDELREMPYAGALAAEPGMKQQTYLRQGMAVRRLTPRECERLQGFPDDYTLIPYRGKPAADGPRYKSLGNSMAVPVMRWIGQRIDAVERLTEVAHG